MLEYIRSLIDWILEVLAPLLNIFFLSVLLLLIGVIIGRVLSTLVQKFLHSADLNRLIEKSTGNKAHIEQIISHSVRYFIYFLFTVLALNTIGITSTLLTIIAFCALAIILFSVILGIKDVIPNSIAGLRLQRGTRFRVGDEVSVGTVNGKIISMNLTDTEIKTEKGDLILIPNTNLLNKKVVRKARKNSKKTSEKAKRLKSQAHQ